MNNEMKGSNKIEKEGVMLNEKAVERTQDAVMPVFAARKDEQGWEPRFPVMEWPYSRRENDQDSPAEKREEEYENEKKEGVMKKMIGMLMGSTERETKPGFTKGGSAMFRKLFGMAVLAAMFVSFASLVTPAYAATSQTAYIVLRCTVTLSVSLVTPNTSFMLGDVSAGTTVYSTDGIVLRNDSLGAICNWSLYIDTNTSLNGWTLSNCPGLNQVAISGVFQKLNVPANFDVVRDTFDATPRYYMDVADGGAFACGDYTNEGFNNVESKILPNMYSTTRSDRKLWIKVQTPG